MSSAFLQLIMYQYRKIVVDLHGVRHIDVSNIVKRAIEDNWDTENLIEFVTGHSKSMQKLVVDEVRKYNLSPVICPCEAKVMLQI